MNNEKGFTLIEVLAAIAITVIVLGAAVLLFSSVNLEWNTTVNRNELDTDANLTVSTLSRNLAHTVELYGFPPSGAKTEWRFKTGEGSTDSGQYKYKAIRYTTQNVNGTQRGVLTLYELNNPAQYTNTTTAIDYSNPANYQASFILADQLSASQPVTVHYDSDQNAATPAVEVPNTVVKNGSLVTIRLPFQYTQARANAPSVLVDRPQSITIKMIKDYID